MNIDNIPESSTHKNSARIGLALPEEVKLKLEYLKNVKKKDVPEFLREIIAEAVKDVQVPLDFAG